MTQQKCVEKRSNEDRPFLPSLPPLAFAPQWDAPGDVSWLDDSIAKPVKASRQAGQQRATPELTEIHFVCGIEP